MDRRAASQNKGTRVWLLCAFCLLGALLASAANAQAEWVVVPYGQPDPGRAQRGAELLVRALLDRRVQAVSLHETRDRYVARSQAPVAVNENERAAIGRGRDQALEHAAYGRREAARKAAEQVLATAERNIQALDRDSDTARNVLDACLVLVRVDLQANDRRRAVDEAKRCKRLVPDLSPKETTHAAEVIGALAEAENQLRRAGAAPLVIDTDGERVCAVFVHGRRLGTTPFRLEGAAPGSTRIDLECGGQHSRVHVVALNDTAQALQVNPGHDARVRDEPVLMLTYASSEDERAHVVVDARHVAELTGARQVVLVREAGKDALQLVRYDVLRARAVASTLVPSSALSDPRAHVWEQAAEALALERQDHPLPAAFLGPAPREARASEAPGASKQEPASRAQPSSELEPTPAARPRTADEAARAENVPSEPETQARTTDPPPRRGVLITGGVLSGAGAMVLATGYGLYARSQTLKQRAEGYDVGTADQATQQQKYDDFKNLPLIGLAGSVLLSTAVPMLLPKHGPRSAFAWVGGALAGLAGAGLIAYGAANTADDGVLEALLMSSGVPLIEIPLTQIVRAAKD